MQSIGPHIVRKSPAELGGGAGPGDAENSVDRAPDRNSTGDSTSGLSSAFAHLHFSFLAGASSPEALAAAAQKHGISALALTDVNGVYGVVRFQKACKEAGIKPIFGAEVSVEGAPLVLIARDEEGFSNLNLMLTEAHQRSREDPQVRLTELMEHADGLFCLTGAYGSRLYELIDRHERAELSVDQFRHIAGSGALDDRLSWDYETHSAARIHPMTLARRTLNEYEIRPIASCFELGRVSGGQPLSMGRGVCSERRFGMIGMWRSAARRTLARMSEGSRRRAPAVASTVTTPAGTSATDRW